MLKGFCFLDRTSIKGHISRDWERDKNRKYKKYTTNGSLYWLNMDVVVNFTKGYGSKIMNQYVIIGVLLSNIKHSHMREQEFSSKGYFLLQFRSNFLLFSFVFLLAYKLINSLSS